MPTLKNIKIIYQGSEIGRAATGAFKSGPRNLAGLRDVTWSSDNPAQYIGRVVTLNGTFTEGGSGSFLNDMTLTQINGNTASFETDGRRS